MFLDEPTTGLDSTNAAKVVDIPALGDDGVTVVLASTSATDVFRLLDRILVMSGTGRPCTPASNSARRTSSRRVPASRPEATPPLVLDVARAWTTKRNA